MIPAHSAMNFDETPFLVIWEVTQACDLSCKHCRAAAQPLRSPEELSTAEGKRLIDQIADLHVPIFVMTGGDPIKRPDIFELIRYATGKGVHTALTPSATPLLTREVMAELKNAGLARLAVSLDGSTREIHDNFRQLPGAYDKTLQAIEWANQVGLPVQIHTTATRHNLADLDQLAALLHDLEIVMWSVFFLVPVGRGQKSDLLTADEFEQVFAKLYKLSKEVPFQIKTTEGMHYRRYILQQHAAELAREKATDGRETPSQFRTQQWATRRVNDGRGFVFVSHTGNVYPSGFLPIAGGSIRQQSLKDIYRDSPVFRTLRDLSLLHGKCGACEFKEICGGSRARAFALTGDLLAEESCCIYQPRNYHAPEFALAGQPA